jgi:hypothetical protein
MEHAVAQFVVVLHYMSEIRSVDSRRCPAALWDWGQLSF